MKTKPSDIGEFAKSLVYDEALIAVLLSLEYYKPRVKCIKYIKYKQYYKPRVKCR